VLPIDLAPRRPLEERRMMVSPRHQPEQTVGVDLFIDSELPPGEVAERIQAACAPPLRVTMVSNRGTQVWPTGSVYTDCVNHHRVRVESEVAVDPTSIFELAGRVSGSLRIASLEALLRIGDAPAYSLAQGQ
jgi:isocitrate dehydrogenase